MSYYKLLSSDKEFQAICEKRNNSLAGRIQMRQRGEERLGMWITYHQISQAEFETYQAFGIKEIKML